MRGYQSIFVLSLCLTFFAGCLEDPLRTHPLDPQGDSFLDEGGIAVHITNFYPPREGLGDISVSVSPGDISGFTNDEGRFLATRLSSGVYTLLVDTPGYAPIDTLIEVTAGETSAVELPLPGLPRFTAFELNSLHLSRWFPPPEELFSLEILAQLEDYDGIADIDSLWLTIENFDFEELLFVQVEPGTFIHSIPASRLPIGINAMLGREVQLRAKDRLGMTNASPPQRLVRVIDQTPLALSPQDLELLSDPQPTFTWDPLTLAYPFTFRIDIVRIDQNVQSTIQTIENIPSSSTSLVAPSPIPSGEYFWTLSVVDEFGNRSRSREAGFRIQ